MTKKNTRRIGFIFDEHSFSVLDRMTKEGPFSSWADTVRESLYLHAALRAQAEQGFTELVVRNPRTGDERVVVIPSLRTNTNVKERQSDD